MMNNYEDLLRENYCQFRFAQGKKNIFKEIPVFSRSVDLVEYDGKLRKITAIEFKIKDWKRAIDQLTIVSTCFDYLVLCLPRPKTETCLSRIKAKCNERGIGLVTWESENNSFSYICEPKEATSIWDVQKKQVISYIKKQKEGGKDVRKLEIA